MKEQIIKYMKLSTLATLLLIAVGCVTTQVEPQAADHKAMSLLSGDTLILYNGTGDTAVTFSDEDAYSTNRTYVNGLGDTVTPKGTNSITGALVPGFTTAIPVYSLSTGGVNDNAAIAVDWGINGALTNSATIKVAKSVDGGTVYDDNPDTFFTFVIPAGTDDTIETLVTNVPTSFLAGASHIKIHSIQIGANPTDDAQLTVNSITLGIWAP